AAADDHRITLHREMGHVADIFTQRVLAGLTEHTAIGHTRYSTAGQSTLSNAQPLFFKTSAKPLAIAHNGNLVNAEELRKELESSGTLFQSTSDTEVIVHLVAREKDTLVERIQKALERVRGAYSLVFLSEDSVVAVRDPLGFHPLVLG